MFSGTMMRAPPHCIIPSEPRDADGRSMHFVWTADEDLQLKALHNQFGTNWQLIADVFNASRITIPTDIRNAWDCYKRYRFLVGEDGTSVKGGGPSEMMGSPAMTRRETAANKAAGGGGGNRKLPVQVSAARAAGGRRPMRHSIIFEVVKRLINKRLGKPACEFGPLFRFWRQFRRSDSA